MTVFFLYLDFNLYDVLKIKPISLLTLESSPFHVSLCQHSLHHIIIQNRVYSLRKKRKYYIEAWKGYNFVKKNSLISFCCIDYFVRVHATWMDFLLGINSSERLPPCFYWPSFPLPLLMQEKYWTRTCATTSVCSFRRAPWTISSSRWLGTTCTCVPFPVSSFLSLGPFSLLSLSGSSCCPLTSPDGAWSLPICSTTCYAFSSRLSLFFHSNKPL